MNAKFRNVVSHHPAAIGLIVRGDTEEFSRRLVLDRARCLELYYESRALGRSRLDSFIDATCPQWAAYYHGPGHGFRQEPIKIRNGRKWIVWYQRGGLDV